MFLRLSYSDVLSSYVLGTNTYVPMLGVLAVSTEDIVPALWNLRVTEERQLTGQRYSSPVVKQLGAESGWEVGGWRLFAG